MADNPTFWIVTGTGTDVGKTVVSAGLLRAAHAAGHSVQIIKAVQTGCDRLPDGRYQAPDVELYRQACPQAECFALRCFRNPCSPHLAAAMEGGEILVPDLVASIRALAANADITIVEGAGGLLVPLNETETFADLAGALGGKMVVAAANGLGAINHALLTLEALRLRGMPADALVANQTAAAASALEADITADNLAVFARMGKVPCMASLPYYPTATPGAFSPAAWDDIALRLAPVVADLLRGREEAKDFDVIDFDHKHLWHPYAPTTPPPPVWEVASTKGTEIRLGDGRVLVDGMSSWWSAVHGFNHPQLVAAIQEQAAIMPHVMFGGLTHRPAARLGEKLLELAPAGLERIFYVDSGSVAVEAALKMAIQYQQAAGKPDKRRFLTALGGYHGDTIGAMSVCDPVNGMHQLFTGMLAQQLFVERPRCRFDQAFDDASLQPMRDAFAVHGGEIAAVIIEPIVQGAGGMWFYHPDYLRGLRELCDKHGALLILDEIATGFGRTGRLFAAEWAGIAPDIMCIGKALTGGSMTLAAVMARETVAATISQKGVFMHGPTFMANPLACSVALASLNLLTSTPWRKRVAVLECQMRNELEPCRNMSGVADVRILGGIGVVEMEREINAAVLQSFFVDAGVWIRPFAKLIYIMPPFVSSTEDVAKLTRAVCAAVEKKAWR